MLKLCSLLLLSNIFDLFWCIVRSMCFHVYKQSFKIIGKTFLFYWYMGWKRTINYKWMYLLESYFVPFEVYYFKPHTGDSYKMCFLSYSYKTMKQQLLHYLNVYSWHPIFDTLRNIKTIAIFCNIVFIFDGQKEL